jgi:hypothetical protein
VSTGLQQGRGEWPPLERHGDVILQPTLAIVEAIVRIEDELSSQTLEDDDLSVEEEHTVSSMLQ